MPQAKRSTSTRSNSKFKQPQSLKRLSTSLDGAQKALGEFSKSSGRDLSKGAKDIYTDLRKVVSDARQHSTKLAKALQREFDQAQKQLTKTKTSPPTRSSSRSTGKRSTGTRASSSRSTSARSTSARSTSSRSTSSRAASSRASGGRSTTRRASSGSGSTKRSSSSSKRRTGKS